MIILWLLGGIIIVSVAFFLPGQSAEIWPQLNSAGVAAAVYVLALLLFTIRKPLSRKQQIISWAFSLVSCGAIALWWTGMYTTTHWQQERLHEIRSVVSRGRIQDLVQRPLLQSLEAYHKQGAKKKESLGQTFQRLNRQAELGTDIHAKDSKNDSLSVFVQELEADKVVLIAQEAYVRGRSTDFRNHNNRFGKIQEKFTLTEKGVNHESEN